MWWVNEEKQILLLSAQKHSLCHLTLIVPVSETYQMYSKEFIRDPLEEGYLADPLHS